MKLRLAVRNWKFGSGRRLELLTGRAQCIFLRNIHGMKLVITGSKKV